VPATPPTAAPEAPSAALPALPALPGGPKKLGGPLPTAKPRANCEPNFYLDAD
jgi:hypothetical protein